MKISAKQLRIIIAEELRSVLNEGVEADRLIKIAKLLTSNDLNNVVQGIELANTMGYDVELERAPTGFINKEYNIFTPSEELYNVMKSLGKYVSAGAVDPQNRLFVITIEVDP